MTRPHLSPMAVMPRVVGRHILADLIQKFSSSDQRYLTWKPISSGWGIGSNDLGVSLSGLRPEKDEKRRDISWVGKACGVVVRCCCINAFC